MAKRQKKSPEIEDLEDEIEESGGESDDDGAQVEIRTRGSSKDVAKALAGLGGGKKETPGEEEKKDQERFNRFLKALSDPGNIVVVRRVWPREHLGIPCTGEVLRMECPVPLEDLKSMVFAEAGGHKFRVEVRDIHGRPVDAIHIENPDTTVPKVISVDNRSEGSYKRIDTGQDPTLVEDEGARTLQELERERQILQVRKRIAEARRELAELTEGKKPHSDAALIRLESRLERLTDRIEDLQSSPSEESDLKREIEDLKRKLEDANRDSERSMMMTMFQTMQKQTTDLIMAMQKQTTDLLQALNQNRSQDMVDSQIERLVRIKQLFADDKDKVSRFDDLIMDLAMEKIRGSSENQEDPDVIKFAIKELIPPLKELAEKELNKRKSETLSRDEIREIYMEQAKRVAAEIREKYERARALPQSAQSAPQQAIPAPSPQREQVTSSAPAQPDSSSAPLPRDSENEGPQIPPSPASPAYDRKRAVNFVLDSLIDEIRQGCPAEAYVIGDILDRLDSEILDQVMKAETDRDLEKILEPYADPAKISEVKRLAESDPMVKSWIRRVVVTVQEELHRQLQAATEKGERDVRVEPGPPPEEKSSTVNIPPPPPPPSPPRTEQ